MCINELNIKPITDDDIERLTTWLNKDYIKKWYECPEDWLNEVINRNEEFKFIKHYIIFYNNKSIGFCQYYDCYYAKEDWYMVDKKDDTFSIDYLIGEEEYLNKGYGTEAINSLKSEIIKNEKCRKIIVLPEKENIASNKALLSAGYIYDNQNNYYYINI